MKTCLNCEYPVTESYSNRCICCGLETEVFECEHGWGDYWFNMKYRFNYGRWTYVPDGMLPIFFEVTL